ncbi:hypothetical protein GJ744_010902 [Endocarpon pusillum]|uniref:Uncharacterized protein n=1 Tax=Endocarpon pusillum TaxID=364733 RepID=A0A8H7AFF1_9EURO|nr:hypothetical protein GJ744_010902 [Endocarpon pusillum]
MNPIVYVVEDTVALAKRQNGAQNGRPTDPDGLVLEAWAQGFMVGALIIMSCITLANMRRGVLLHKLILIELIFGVWHGFFIFFHSPIYNWWLSVSAIFLNASWSLHNVIAWLKNKPFLSRRVSLIYIGTVILVQPYWVLEIYANFTYFHDINTVFLKTRPVEALFRDPWWIFTTISLFYNIKTRYDLSLPQIVRLSPRFAVMLGAMVLSICFLVVDICSVTGRLASSLPVGINPFWKLSFVFKCLTDCVVLDDFKTALDRLRAFKISRLGSFALDNAESGRVLSNDPANGWPGSQARSKPETSVPSSPDGDELSQQRKWPAGKQDPSHPDGSNRQSRENRELSQIRESSSDTEVARNNSGSPIPRPQSSWLRDSGEGDYAQALRDVTRSSQSEPSHTERDAAIARAR